MLSPSVRRASPLLASLATVACMIAIVSVSVPLYRLFCAVTGAGGTTQRVARDTARVAPKQVTVFFNTDVSPTLPWRFAPVQRSVRLHLGAQVPAYFTATNLTDHSIVGHATFNVTPDKAGIYFKKLQCFCFTEERLGPHETVRMPVQFFVDPAIASDPSTADVDQITLSYTFFASKRPEGAPDLARLAATQADPARGGALFVAQCGACHALDHAKVGPALAGVIGRRAGSAPGYPYTSALARSGLMWTEQSVTRWLINPQASAPGTAMPMAVADAADRRDIVAYLARSPATAAR